MKLGSTPPSGVGMNMVTQHSDLPGRLGFLPLGCVDSLPCTPCFGGRQVKVARLAGPLRGYHRAYDGTQPVSLHGNNTREIDMRDKTLKVITVCWLALGVLGALAEATYLVAAILE